MSNIMITEDNQLSQVYDQDLYMALKDIRDMEDYISQIKQKLMEEMEEKGIIKVETDRLVVTKVSPSTREQFDKKAFREENPDLYDKYCKIASASGYIKIEMKKAE